MAVVFTFSNKLFTNRSSTRTPQRVVVVSDPSRAQSLWESVYASADGFDTSTYFDFVIEACAAGRSEEEILWTINKFRTLQIQTGDELGRVPRTLSATLNYSDLNNIEFALQLASVALAEYYPSSQYYKMNMQRLIETSTPGDMFYLIVCKNKIIQIYNTKYFEIG